MNPDPGPMQTLLRQNHLARQRAEEARNREIDLLNADPFDMAGSGGGLSRRRRGGESRVTSAEELRRSVVFAVFWSWWVAGSVPLLCRLLSHDE